jgi:hypothetical protein
MWVNGSLFGLVKRAIRIPSNRPGLAGTHGRDVRSERGYAVGDDGDPSPPRPPARATGAGHSASARRAASSNGVSSIGSSIRIRSSRAIVGLRSPSTSGLATDALTGVTRFSQSEER